MQYIHVSIFSQPHREKRLANRLYRFPLSLCLCLLPLQTPNPFICYRFWSLLHPAYNSEGVSMGFYGKHKFHNNADGRYPDFGAIFMSNSATKRECFKRKLFGLPSSEIKFIEKVKNGMVLFLFEYDKRQLHGVFRASCDGGVNIVPNAFTTSGKQFPAQVKFTPIWFCEPLPEKIFRGAIKENYFSTYKFNFGLSEKQVSELLYLFSKRKLEVEAPGKSLTRKEYFKSDRETVGKVRRYAGRERHVESVRNEQSMDGHISPISMHKYHRDSLQHNGEDEFIGLNRSDIVVNKQGQAVELQMDTTNGYGSEYLALKDENRFTARESEDYISIRTSEFAVDTNGYVCDYLAFKGESRYTVRENNDDMDIHIRPNIMGGYSKSQSDKISPHGDLRLSIRDTLMRQGIKETDQRMVDDIPGLHNYDVNPPVFYREPRSTSPTQRDVSTRSNLLYNAVAPGLNFNQSSSVGFTSGSKSIIETISPPRNREMNSLNSQPHLMRTELKDMSRWHEGGGGFLNSVLYGSNRGCMLFDEALNSDLLASESLLTRLDNSILSLKPSSGPIPPSDIGNYGRVHESFSSVFYDSNSCLSNNVNPVALQDNMTREITLLKNNETFSPDIPWANEGHSQVQYSDSLNHEYDIGSYGDSQTNNSGHPKNKPSVFSRLSFMQDVNKQESVKNSRKKERDFQTSVDEVMEMACHSHNQWMAKIMSKDSKPIKHKKAESSSSRNQLIGPRMKDDCCENTLEDLSTDLASASGDNSDKVTEEISFMDFKRRSKLRKLSEVPEIRSSNESEKSENVQPKRRKLIRPNFNHSTTPDDTGMNLGASQNLPLSHGSCNLKDASQSGCALPQTEEQIKASILALLARAEVQKATGHTHSEDKNNSHTRGHVHSEGGEKATDSALTAFNDGPECVESVKNQHAFSSFSGKDKSCHIKEGFSAMDSIKSVSQNTESFHSICQELNAEVCAGRGMDAEEKIQKDCGHSVSAEVKNGSEYGNEIAPIETPHINEGSHVMDGTKSVSPGTESLHSVCQGHHLDKITCPGGVINTDNQNASITSKEGLGMIDSVKSVSADSESLHSVGQVRHADKVLYVGIVINTEEGMPKDGSSTEFKDGSDPSHYKGNDNVPIKKIKKRVKKLPKLT